MKTFKFKTQGRYTIVYSELNSTYLQEIVITKKTEGRTIYRVTRRLRGDSLVTPSKKHRYFTPSTGDLHEWLIFEGHDLPLTIASRGGSDNFQLFRFISKEPESLRTFIQDRCLNPSIPGFANISVSENDEFPSIAVNLFPASIKFHGEDLYEDHEEFPGVFYGINGQGEGVLHDAVHYHGHAYRYSFDGPKYRVDIHRNLFNPDLLFRRNGYKSQEAANKALLFHARRIYHPLPAQ